MRYQVTYGVTTTLTLRDRRLGARVCARAAADDEVRVVVVTGVSDAFCSGVDLSVLSAVDLAPLTAAQIEVHGARYPEHLKRTAGL